MDLIAIADTAMILAPGRFKEFAFVGRRSRKRNLPGCMDSCAIVMVNRNNYNSKKWALRASPQKWRSVKMYYQIFRTAALFLGVALVPTTVFAQQTPAPHAINECTQLRDPTRLKECIEGHAGLESRTPSMTPQQPGTSELLGDKDAMRVKAGAAP